jgi:hypothetical protein
MNAPKSDLKEMIPCVLSFHFISLLQFLALRLTDQSIRCSIPV